MSAFLTLDSIALATPDGQPLFDGLTLAVGRERIGVVGRNGSGKSSLLRLLAGEIDPAGGTLARMGSVGTLAQFADDRLTIAEALNVADALDRLRRLEAGGGSPDDAARADWTLPARLDAAMGEVGLPELPFDRSLITLSGGERTRVALARLLVEAPDILLLDEPTNNLDSDGRAAMAQLIAHWPGAVVVASHDRDLLEGMDRIVELTPIGATIFGGGWSAFHTAREAARARAEADPDRAALAMRATRRAVQKVREGKARRDKAGRTARLRGGESKLFLGGQQERAENSGARQTLLAGRLIDDRAETLDAARERLERITPLAIDLPPTGLPANRQLVALRDVVMARGDRRLFGPLSFEVRGPERIAIRGRNGSGKSTLLHMIRGDFDPPAGTVRRTTDRVALLDQQVALLDPATSLLDNLRRIHPGLSDHDARATLARYAFRNSAALQIVATLSGGERLRGGLACVFARPAPPQLLLLDEPTNHLDLASIAVLEAALATYDGALVVVSHDAAFLRTIGVQRDIEL